MQHQTIPICPMTLYRVSNGNVFQLFLPVHVDSQATAWPFSS